MVFVKTRKLSCYNHNLYFDNRVDFFVLHMNTSNANLNALHNKSGVVDYFFLPRHIDRVSVDFAKWNNHSPIINKTYSFDCPSYPTAVTGSVQSVDKLLRK